MTHPERPGAAADPPAPEVTAIVDATPEPMRTALLELRAILRAAAPEATDTISYAIPALRYRGRALVAYAAWKEHVSLYPMGPHVTEAFADELRRYPVSEGQGAIRFAPHEPLPRALIERIVRMRMAQVDERTARGRSSAGRSSRMGPSARKASSTAPLTSEEAVRKATGRSWDQWFAALDAWSAASRPHPEIARWLASEHAVPAWWTQAITVSYERARGLRAAGQRPEGWSVSATKTVGVPVERLYAAFEDEALRGRWLPDAAELRPRSATPPRVIRYDWAEGPSRVEAGFTALGPGKSRVAVEHSRLPDAAATVRHKAWWRERLVALKTLLEAGSETEPIDPT